MKVYKYMSMDIFKAFEKNNTLRLTKSHSQNDPFEFSLSYIDLHNLYKKSEYKEDFTEFMNMSGCVSMTTDKENIYMWSHYADNHKGVMIEFTFDENEPENLFLGSANVYKNSPIKQPTGFLHAPVDYKKSRRLETSNGDLENIINTLYFRKSKAWDKESEYRFILPFTETREILLTQKGLDTLLENIELDGFKERFVNNNENEKYIFKIDALSVNHLLTIKCIHILHKIWKTESTECIFVVKMNTDKLTGIYFGCRSDVNQCGIKNDTSYFDGKFYSVMNDSIQGIYQAEVDANDFKLNFSPAIIPLSNLAE